MTSSLLTAAEIEHYRDEGYVNIDRPIVPAAALAVVRRRLDALFDRYQDIDAAHRNDLGDGTSEHAALPEINSPSALDPRLALSRAARILRRVGGELLGTPRVRWHFDHAIYKPAGIGAATGWHQDVAFDPTHDEPMATIWLPLGDAVEASGCLGYAPRSHRGPIHDHVRNGRDGLRIDEDFGQTVMCPVHAGGLNAHHVRTIHGAGPNTTSDTRRTWIVKFLPDGRPLPQRVLSEARQLQRARRAGTSANQDA